MMLKTIMMIMIYNDNFDHCHPGGLQLPDDDVDVRELGGGISLSLQHVFL